MKEYTKEEIQIILSFLKKAKRVHIAWHIDDLIDYLEELIKVKLS